MSNRHTKGEALFGAVEASGGVVAQTVTSSSGGVVFTHGSVTATRKIKALSFTGPGTTADTSASYSLPTSGLLHDIWVKITTASSAAGVLNVGLSATTSGDADGFIVSLGSSSTGIFYPGATVTAATSGDIVTGNTRGALLSTHATGTTDLGSWGYYARKDFVLGSIDETAVVFSMNSTSEVAGVIYLEHTEI